MPLVPAKCPNCGGAIEVDNAKDAAICSFCRTPFVVEKAINNYIHNTHIEKVIADNVTLVDERSSKARLEAAEAYMTLRQYASAQKAFEDASALVPQDYRGWWGQVRARTDNLETVPSDPSDLEKLKKLYNSALTVASGEDRKTIEEQYTDYWISVVKPKIAGITAELAGVAAEIADQSAGENAEKEKTSAEIASLEERMKALEEKKAAADRETAKRENKSSRWNHVRHHPGLPTLICTIIAILIFILPDAAAYTFDNVIHMCVSVTIIFAPISFCLTKIIAKIGESTNDSEAAYSRGDSNMLNADINRLRNEIAAKKNALSDSVSGFQRRSADAAIRQAGLTRQKAATENLRP